MVTVEQLKNGIAKYVDCEIISKLSGWQRWIVGGITAAYTAQMSSIVEKIRTHPALSMLNLVTEHGMIDIDSIYSYIRPYAKNPAQLNIPGVGTFSLTEQDVLMIYNYITQ